jgi:arabinose-5-phosphate isomerase
LKKTILDIARECIEIEQNALFLLTKHLDNNLENSVKSIISRNSRVVVTGIGKSALIGHKIVATMNSTGTGAVFLHAADALHGDIGMLNRNDHLCCISKSGETEEIKLLLPIVKSIGCKIISITANKESYLAKQSDYILYTPIEIEADPNNLAPTASTAAQMAMGDALAVCLMYERGFTSADFAKFHPAGSLGKQLYLHVYDVYPLHGRPVNKIDDTINAVILTMSKNRLGATVITDNDEKIIGIITDGDLRRMLERPQNFSTLKAMDIMNTNPKTIQSEALAIDALELMRKNNISQLVVTQDGRYVGMVHLHDLVKEGLI